VLVTPTESWRAQELKEKRQFCCYKPPQAATVEGDGSSTSKVKAVSHMAESLIFPKHFSPVWYALASFDIVNWGPLISCEKKFHKRK
jgi:hypothetical protein